MEDRRPAATMEPGLTYSHANPPILIVQARPDLEPQREILGKLDPTSAVQSA